MSRAARTQRTAAKSKQRGDGAQSLSPPAAGVGIKAEREREHFFALSLTKMYSSVSDRATGLRVMASLDCLFSVARGDTLQDH